MTAKPKKAKPKRVKQRKARSRRGGVIELKAPVEDDLLSLAEEEEEEGRRGALEPSTQAEDLVARGYRSGRLVQIQRPGLPDTNQPDIERVMMEGKRRAGER